MKIICWTVRSVFVLWIKPKTYIMKRILFILLACFLTASHGYSQSVGLKGGVNFSNLYISDVDDENMKIGFNAGVYHRNMFTDNLGMQTELFFTQKGSEVTNSTLLGNSYQYRFVLNYLELPVMLNGQIGGFNLHVGLYFGFLLSAKTKEVDDDGTPDDINALDRDDFNTIDYGATGGLSFDFEGGMIGLRYSYGFQEIGKGQAATDATPDSKNSTLQLYLGLEF